MRTLLQITLVDVAALVADSIRNIECQVVTSLDRSHVKKVTVLLLSKVLLKVHMKSRTSCKVIDVTTSMETDLVDDVQRLILNDIEIRVVALTRHYVTILPVPLRMLYTDVLCRNHLAVEHKVLCAVLLVVSLHKTEDLLNELLVLRVVVDGDSEELGSLNKTIYTDSEVLA